MKRESDLKTIEESEKLADAIINLYDCVIWKEIFMREEMEYELLSSNEPDFDLRDTQLYGACEDVHQILNKLQVVVAVLMDLKINGTSLRAEIQRRMEQSKKGNSGFHTLEMLLSCKA